MTAINFEHAFDTWVGATDKVWKHDRTKSLGASEAFGCIRKAWFAKNDTPRDPGSNDSWGALRRGDMIENHFVEPAIRWFLQNKTPGTRLVFGGARQKTFQAKDAPLSATPDGLIIGADDDALADYGIPSLGGAGCFNFEVKSIDPRVNLKEEKSIHNGQVQVQMGLTRERTIYKPNFAVIIYVDCSFLDEIDVFVVPFDEKMFQIAKARAKQVYATTDPMTLPAEGKWENGCEYCPFKGACTSVTRGATPTEGEMISNQDDEPLPIMVEFEELIREERAASAAKKASEARHKEASEMLKEWFRQTGVRRAEVQNVVKASLSWIKGRKSTDLDAMRADGIDVEKYQVEGDGYDRITISEKGSKTPSDE